MLRYSILATLSLLAATDAGPGLNYSDWGIAAILAWYLWYTTAVAQPRNEQRHREELSERDKRYIRDSMAREERFEQQLDAHQRAFLDKLKQIADQSSADRKRTRAVIRRFTSGDKDMSEALLRLSGLIERREREAREELEDRTKRLERHASPKEDDDDSRREHPRDRDA